MSNKITLLLEENLIRQAKKKAIDSDTSISEFCRIILNAWHLDLFGYEKYENKSKLPEHSGVYFIIQNNKVVYIGQSKNIKNRIINHNHVKEFKAEKDTTVFWFNIDGQDLLNVEKLCIELLTPELNKDRNTTASEDLKILSTQIDIQFYKLLRTKAAEKDMSISALVRKLLEQALNA